MKKINGITVYEENDKCALDEYSVELEKDLSTKFSEKKKNIKDIESNIETLEERTTSLESKTKKHDKDIANLQSKSQELEEDSQALRDFLSNIMPQGEAEGKTIKVTDSARLPCEITIVPNNEQEISEASANILDLTKLELTSSSKCTIDSKSENEITLTSTNETGASYARFKTKLKAGTWYVKSTYEKISDTDIDTTGKVTAQKVSDWSYVFSLSKTVNSISFTLEEDTEMYITFHVKGTADTSTDIITARFYNLMFSKENIDYTPFVPQKPSFEYPSKIKKLKNKVNLKIQNKNIAPINTTDWELTENNTIKNKAKNAGLDLTEFDLKKGQTVKVSIKMVSKPSVSTSFSGYVDGTNVSSFGFNGIHGFNLNQIYTRTYTVTEDCRIKYTLWGNANSETFEFQLWAEINDTTDYIVHEEQNYELDIQQEMLVGDKIDLGNNKEIHTWEKIVLDGTQDIKLGTAPTQENTIHLTYSYNNASLSSYSINTKSNKLKSCTAADVWNNDKEGIGQSATQLVLRLSKEKATNLEEAKTYLSENNVICYFKKAQATELDLTETQKNQLKEIGKAYTYKGTTNISTDSVAILNSQYSKDIETLLAVTEEE